MNLMSPLVAGVPAAALLRRTVPQTSRSVRRTHGGCHIFCNSRPSIPQSVNEDRLWRCFGMTESQSLRSEVLLQTDVPTKAADIFPR